jgi:hypothetical protein
MVSVEPPSTVLPGLDVLDRRADDALGVDAVVVPEALVLDGDRRVLERLRDLLAGDRGAQDVGLDEAEALDRWRRRRPTWRPGRSA